MILYILLLSLLNQDSYLVKQGEVEVPLSDLDAYVYLLDASKRAGFADQHKQIEQNIYTILNINIVHHYISQSEYKDLPEFKEASQVVKDEEIKLDEEFAERLNLDQDEVIKQVRDFRLKMENYKSMLKYLNETVDEDVVNQLAREQYLVNKKEYTLPEKRDVSVIVMNAEDQGQAEELMTTLLNQSVDEFHAAAGQNSIDPSAPINQGNWGEFRQIHFTYPFADTVFNAPVGVIPRVLKDRQKLYIVRVNEIEPERALPFDEVKEDLIKKSKNNAVVRKFQSIINTQAMNKLEVNPELVAHVFERYKVFAEE
jgi:parvulin-like peptidyl-prolyl isomerase